MRRAVLVLICGFFTATLALGCGAGTTIPAAPEGAKAGPPPGTAPDMSQFAPKDKAGKKK